MRYIILFLLPLLFIGCQKKFSSLDPGQDDKHYLVKIKSGRFVHNNQLYRVKRSQFLAPMYTDTAFEITMKRKKSVRSKDAIIHINDQNVTVTMPNENYFEQSQQLVFLKKSSSEDQYYLLSRVLSNNDAISNVKLHLVEQ